MSKKLTITGTGDALFLAPFPKEYDAQLEEVSSFIKSCDVKLTNLETNLSDFNYCGNSYSGGTWLNTRRKYLPELLKYGFNFFGTANNHAMDYSYNGLLSTIDTLDANNLAHAGTGRTLDEAEAPAILNIDGKKIAILAVDSSFNEASKAGRATPYLPGRPGVNFLRRNTCWKVSPEELEQLKAIAARTKINKTRERLIDTGYLTPDKPGEFYLQTLLFTTDQERPETSCNAADKKRLLDGIRKAKSECDYVFIMVHCHTDDNIREENPAEFFKEFARECIDAGVSAVFGGGCHRLRGIEIYKGLPIFYSLGDFIYQGLKVEYLPADFMEKYNADITLTASEALWVRSRGNKVGLHCQKCNFQTILPKLEFEDGKMTSFKLLPIYLNFDQKNDLNGLPAVARGAEADEILDILNENSEQFGVKLKQEDGFFVLA